MARGGNGMTDGPERRNGIMKGQSKKEKELPPSQNGIAKKALSDIQILHTDTLVKEVYPIPYPSKSSKNSYALTF